MLDEEIKLLLMPVLILSNSVCFAKEYWLQNYGKQPRKQIHAQSEQ